MSNEVWDIFSAFFDRMDDSEGRPMFRGKNLGLAEAAIDLLAGQSGPVTLRQLYYLCVSAGHIANSQAEYRRLGNVVTRLREEGHVPLSAIVDHVRQTLKPSSWSGLADFGDTVRNAYRKDLWSRQSAHVEFFIEKDATAGVIHPITAEYDVALHVCRGFASLSFVGTIAENWEDSPKETIYAYYLGDYDASGFDIERDLKYKLARYSGREFEWRRLGVVHDDFDDFDLIALPVKTSDSRARKFRETHGERCAELDALPPQELRDRVRAAIIQHIDAEEWERLQNIEKLEKETSLAEAIARLRNAG